MLILKVIHGSKRPKEQKWFIKWGIEDVLIGKPSMFPGRWLFVYYAVKYIITH